MTATMQRTTTISPVQSLGLDTLAVTSTRCAKKIWIWILARYSIWSNRADDAPCNLLVPVSRLLECMPDWVTFMVHMNYLLSDSLHLVSNQMRYDSILTQKMWIKPTVNYAISTVWPVYLHAEANDYCFFPSLFCVSYCSSCISVRWILWSLNFSGRKRQAARHKIVLTIQLNLSWIIT